MDIKIIGLFTALVILIFILVKSADLVEDSFVLLAKKIGVSEFVLGFVLLSAISSLPEISIAISSNDVVPELSVGNLFGATLILLSLVAGLSAIKFKNISFRGKFNETEVLIALLIIALMIFTALDATFSLLEGVGLVFMYFLYVFQLSIRFKNLSEQKEQKVQAKKLFRLLIKSAIGVFGILASAALIVDTVISIGNILMVSEALLGLLVLAVGTNLPELTMLIRAKHDSQQNLAFGNIMGSAAINTLILGCLIILSQGFRLAIVDVIALTPVMVILSITILAFVFFSWTGRKLTRSEGVLLISCYISLIIAELLIILIP